MTTRENFIYFILGKVDHKLFANADNHKLGKSKYKDKMLTLTDFFLASCNQDTLSPSEIGYLDETFQYNKQLDDGVQIS